MSDLPSLSYFLQQYKSLFLIPLSIHCQCREKIPTSAASEMMKYTALAMMLLVYLTIQSNAVETSTYTTKYDGIDLDEILNNERLLTGYVNCLMDNGPCTADGKELKRNLPDAIENDCKKCTDRQREGADRVMHYLIDHRPEDWTKLEKKYNSDGSYKMKYLSRKPAEDSKETNTTKSEEDIKNETKEST